MAAVKVFLRERPSEVEPKYLYEENDGVINVTTTTPSYHSKTAHSYILDGIFDCFQTYEDVFNTVGKYAVANVLNSYSSTLICYGATATGKSYTAFGEDNNAGLSFRILDHLFESATARQYRETCSIYVSLTEIYIDKVFDLLNGNQLYIRQDDGGFYCEGLTQVKIDAADQAKLLLDKTLKNRQTAPNYANQYSSRSHVLFSIGVVQTSREDGLASYSILTICDLAGSESLRKSNASGLRLMEAQYINKSLSALCSVVNQLALRNQFIQYRDSKLTMLLQKSLGGNSFTSVICTVYAEQPDESQYTIYFANRCRNVMNNPQVQYTDIGKIEQNALLQKLQQENLELKSRISDLEAELTSSRQNQRFYEQGLPAYQKNQGYLMEYNQLSAYSFHSYPQYMQYTLYYRPNSARFTGSQQATKTPLKQYSAQLPTPDPVRKDSIAILRQKLVAKNEEMQAYMHQHNKYISDYRSREHYLKERIFDLYEQIKNQQEAHARYLRDAEEEKAEALRKISYGADELIYTQKSIAESTVRLVPDSYYQAMDEFDVAEMLEYEKIYLTAQMDVQQLEYRDELLEKHRKDVDSIKQQMKRISEEKNQQIMLLKTERENYYYAVNWLSIYFKTLSNVVMSAREGKIEAFIVNEPEVIYYLIQYQGDMGNTLKRERTRIHTCLILNEAQMPKIPPERVGYVIIYSKASSRPSSSLSANYRPSSALSLKELRKPTQIQQPHMQTGFIKPKPPSITLGMNVHISPRPYSAFSYKTTTSHGSCAGTYDLVNKQYQQWGW